MAAPSRIQREIRQSRPFRSPGHEAVVALARTADQVGRHFAAVIAPHGITPQQYNVLRILRGAGQAGLPTLEIAERMIESTPGITRLLDRLEAKRLVRRQRCPRDRRQVLCYSRPEGLALLSRLDEPVSAADASALRGLRPERVATFIAILDEIRVGLSTLPPAAPAKLNQRRRKS